MAPNADLFVPSLDTKANSNGNASTVVTIKDSPVFVPPVKAEDEESAYKLQIYQSSMNILAHIFIGVVVGVNIVFCFRLGLPLTNTQQHIVLCVIGYQLLMAQATLSLSPANGWSSKLKLVDKRRAHWILQTLGSILALTGSFLKIYDKNIHWNTLHGQFALVAMVFTSVCLVNGVASLYAYEFRGFLNGNFSKVTHIIFGIVAFVTATISLCYGMDKNSFRTWASPHVAYTIMAFTGAFTFIIIIDPFITFFNKSKTMIGKNS